MPLRKHAARANAQNIQIANQRHVKRNQNDIKSESIQHYQKERLNGLQPKQFHLARKTPQPLSLPTHQQNLFWTLSCKTSVHIFTSHPISGNSMKMRITVILIFMSLTSHLTSPTMKRNPNSNNSLMHSEWDKLLH